MESDEVFQLGDAFSECLRLGILQGTSGRFLTAEVFNNEITVSGTSLRRRQVWAVIVERSRPETVYLQSHLGRFLSADKDGKVNGASKSPGMDERFLLEYCPQGTGEWAFRSESHGYYLSGTDTQVTCFSKSPVWWAIRLAIHPQVHLRHHFRSRYARLLPDDAEVRADQQHPWGAETLIWLEQLPMATSSGTGRITNGAIVGRTAVARLGRVALRTEKGLYLKSDGSLTEEMDDSTLFAFELRSGEPRTFAFRDSSGAYFSAIGPGTIRAKSNPASSPGKEELFLIERSSLQIGILAHNNKFASIKQGIEISANQHDLDETAIFQLEYIGGKGFSCSDAIAACNTLPQSPAGDTETPVVTSSARSGLNFGIYCLVTGYWRLRINNGQLWRIAPSTVVQNNGTDGDKETLFEILTLSDEVATSQCQVVLRSNAGESVSAKKLGAISSSGRQVSETQSPPATDVFGLVFVNRPTIAVLSVLTGGFVSRGKQTLLDCSSLNYERFDLIMTHNHTYQIRSKDANILWTACSDGFVHLKRYARSHNHQDDCFEPGTEFLFYFLGNGRFLIRAVGPDAIGFDLLRAESKGEVKCGSATDVGIGHIWEI